MANPEGLARQLTETLELHDAGLAPNLLNELPLGMGPSNSRFGGSSTENGSDRSASRILDDEEERCEHNSQKESQDKVETAEREAGRVSERKFIIAMRGKLTWSCR